MYKDKQNLQKKLKKLDADRIAQVVEGVQKQNHLKIMTSDKAQQSFTRRELEMRSDLTRKEEGIREKLT